MDGKIRGGRRSAGYRVRHGITGRHISIRISTRQAAGGMMKSKLLSRLKSFVPKTAFGEKLMNLRNASIAKGMHLMTVDEIREEVAQRRAGVKK